MSSLSVAPDSVKKKWFEAVTKNDLAMLQHIISNYVFDVDEVSQKGNTAFLMACDLQNKRIAAYLLSIGANKFVQNNDGWTAFHIACMHGNQVFTTWLLGEGLDPHETTRYRRTGFHIACIHGHKALASWLLTLGLSKDALDHKGNNALDLVNLYGYRPSSKCAHIFSLSVYKPRQ